MEWMDDGIVLGVRRHGETSAIVELLTAAHGRHLGLVRGGASRRLRPLLQPGNSVRAVWRARLDEHLGMYTLEGLKLRAAALLEVPHGAYGVTHLAALARLLPERDPHGMIYEFMEATLDRFADATEAAVQLVRFELAILSELGFGLELSVCAATGAQNDLIYVSPKSGGAVSRLAGEPWADRLLKLPAFLRDDDVAADVPEQDLSEQDLSEQVLSEQDLRDGFALTGLFLSRHVLEPRGLAHSDARAGFIAAVTRKNRPRLARAEGT